jgi:hypothetical protein
MSDIQELPKTILRANADFGAGNYRQALAWYDDILRYMLFKLMWPITDQQVRSIQEKRLACFREFRHDGSAT